MRIGGLKIPTIIVDNFYLSQKRYLKNEYRFKLYLDSMMFISTFQITPEVYFKNVVTPCIKCKLFLCDKKYRPNIHWLTKNMASTKIAGLYYLGG